MGGYKEERIKKERNQRMKHRTLLSFVIIMITSLPVATGFASDSTKPMDHSGHIGEKVHESVVQGYQMAYHLLDLPGRTEKHLMTYITGPSGNPVRNAKVGYLVVGPDGVKQRVMAMAMKDAFGGDVNLTAKGNYTIKSKAVFGREKLMDSFHFEVK